MNPFDRLRQTIDKVTINYSIPEEPISHCTYPGQIGQPQTNRGSQTIEIPNIEQKTIALFEQKQIDYIQQINELSLKNQRLEKRCKLMSLEKQQLIQQNSQGEKNMELLERKIEEMMDNIHIHQEKERKYKQQIHRVNYTIEEMGKQLSYERQNKKQALTLSSKQKEEDKQLIEKLDHELNQLKQQNIKLKIEIEERVSMFQYNIKKSAQERKNYVMKFEQQQAVNEDKIQVLSIQNKQLREKMYESYQQAAILKERLDLLSQKYESLTRQLNNYQNENNQYRVLKNNFEEEINRLNNQLSTSQARVMNLERELEEERKNIKVKVVEIKDKTLELELEMYKQQYRESLQKQAINGNYEIIREYQTYGIRHNQMRDIGQ